MLVLFPKLSLRMAPTPKAPPPRTTYSVETILELVTQVTGENLGSMVSQTRARGVTYARHLAWYILNHHSTLSISEIGRMFGWRDHSTVLRGIRRIALEMQVRPETRTDYETIMSQLTG